MRADDIVKQRFTKVFRGYDIQEVDVFLDEIIRALDALEKERAVLLSRVEALLNELDKYDALLKGAQIDAKGVVQFAYVNNGRVQ
ncbi:MAG: DivIVA domain-containing protein [Clostridiales bacterium]|jgi:cell division initiation protein|nr:DivIVA domain-containing protein [Clostridiales bacterium]